jgi:hypothetical protein
MVSLIEWQSFAAGFHVHNKDKTDYRLSDEPRCQAGLSARLNGLPAMILPERICMMDTHSDIGRHG